MGRPNKTTNRREENKNWIYSTKPNLGVKKIGIF
jgi:hypothetical protein